MKFLTKSAALIFVGILIIPCSARLRKQWSPEELLANADVVVLGTVESVVAVERKVSEAAAVFGDRFSLIYYDASIKVNLIIKGENVAETIKLRFSRAVSNRSLITDPPFGIILEPDQLYLFYLVTTDDEFYLNVLHDEVDQDKAVIQIRNTPAEQASEPKSNKAGGTRSSPSTDNP